VVLVENIISSISLQRVLDFNQNFLTFIWPCIMIYFCSKSNEMHQFLKFILFCSSILHVSNGLSVHHQEPKTVHIPDAVPSLRLLMMEGKTVRNM